MKFLTLFTWFTAFLFLFGCGSHSSDTATSVQESAPSDLISTSNAADIVLADEPLEMIQLNILEKAKEVALSILGTAAEQSAPPMDALFRSMIAALARVNFDTPPTGKDLRECKQNKAVLAFVMLQSPNTIHLCARSLRTTSAKKLAQVLIHETSHVVGVHDECQATQVEITAMRASKAGLAFKNGYMQRCGLRVQLRS